MPRAGIVLVVALLTAPAASDASAGDSRCTLAKLRAIVRAVEAHFECVAEEEGSAVTDCLVAANTRLDAAVVEADAVGPCPGSSYDLISIANSECIPFLSEVGDPDCTDAKLAAAGDKTVGKLRCRAHAIQAGGAVDPACLAREERRFLAAFAAAERRAPCGGAADAVEEIVDRCVGLFAVALTCGNGMIDPGEQCDSQRFCTVPDCRIGAPPQCCQVGTDPMAAVCVATPPALELCTEFGGRVLDGFCADAPCPGDPFPGCNLGACTDPSLPVTSACCQRDGTCHATTVTSTLALRNALLDCVAAGGQNVLGSCGSDGRCVAE